jgi:hypothetical protein
LLVTRTAVVAAIAALTAGGAATAATAALSAVTLILITTHLAGRSAALRGDGLIRFAAEDTFQPADKPAGFFLRFGARGAFLKRLILSGFEFPVVTTGLARFEPARFTRVALPAFAGRARFTRLEWPAAFTAFAPLAGRLECPAFIGPRGRLAGCVGRRICLPPQRGAAGILRRQNVEFGLGRSVLSWSRTFGPRLGHWRLASFNRCV